MANNYDILYIEIKGIVHEQAKILPGTDVEALAEKYKKAWGLNDTIDEWQIYYFQPSTNNKSVGSRLRRKKYGTSIP